MLKFCALALAFGLGLSSPALAQESEECVPAQEVLQKIAGAVKQAVKLNPEQTKAVVAWFDSLPPEGESGYDLAILVAMRDGTAGLILGKGDQVCFAQHLREEDLHAVLKAIEGNRV